MTDPSALIGYLLQSPWLVPLLAVAVMCDGPFPFLPSEPVHLGVLPEEDTAFVNQSHPLGRLSFYDPDVADGEAPLQTITGFELNSAIEQ